MGDKQTIPLISMKEEVVKEFVTIRGYGRLVVSDDIVEVAKDIRAKMVSSDLQI